MVKKIKIAKKYIIPSCSFLAICLLILIPIAVIEPTIAEWLLGIGTLVGSVFLGSVKGLREALIDKWTNVNYLVHWGIISIFILSMVYLIYFLRNFKIEIKIIPKKDEL